MGEMPTGAKAAGAVTFAILAFGAATLLLPHLPQSDRGRWFALANAGVGAYIGWRVMGRMVGGDYRAAARAGIYTSVWLLLWSVSLFSVRLMAIRSMQGWYHSATDALTGVVAVAIGYFQMSLKVEVVGVLLLGGMAAGVVTEFVSRHWS